MAINGFKPEEKLYGSANFNSWKARLTTILDENDLDDLVFNATEEPTRKIKVRLEDSFMIPLEKN